VACLNHLGLVAKPSGTAVHCKAGGPLQRMCRPLPSEGGSGNAARTPHCPLAQLLSGTGLWESQPELLVALAGLETAILTTQLLPRSVRDWDR
jgi:hypothetical protein